MFFDYYSLLDLRFSGPFADFVSHQLAPESILFLSDNVKEVEAAISAGMKSLVVDRPGNAPLSAEDRNRFKVIESFEQISLA